MNTETEVAAMDVFLPLELEQFVQSQIESGMYTSASEVIAAGVRLLEEREVFIRGGSKNCARK